MGCYSPSPFVDKETFREIISKVMTPTVSGLAHEGRPYRGILYAGLMLTEEGPKVLEFNCRLGDPEGEALLPRLQQDIVPLLTAAADGSMTMEKPVDWSHEAAVTVVVASGGYPGSYEKGMAIEGVDAAGAVEGAVLFHSGTRRSATARLETAGGRVLAVTAMGAGLEQAAQRCYDAVSKIRFDGMHYRRDVADAAIQRVAQMREEDR
jgi:phosphoribosylamine--glycine ligase